MNTINICGFIGLAAITFSIVSGCTDGDKKSVPSAHVTTEKQIRQKLSSEDTAKSLIRPAPKLPTEITSQHAASLLKPKSQENPTIERHFKKGAEYYKSQNYISAIAQFNEIINLDPENSQAYGNRGLAYSRLDEFELAIEDFSKVIQLAPSDPKAYYSRGTRYAQVGEYEKAIEDYDEAIRLFPTYATAYYSRGMVHQELGEVEKAEADMQKGLELGHKQPGP